MAKATRRKGGRPRKTAPRRVRASKARTGVARAPRRRAATDDNALREDLLSLLRGRGAHVAFEKAVAEMPRDLEGKKPAGVPYTPWQQLEHLRRCQRDILDYIRNPHYEEQKWPDDYWPAEAPPSAGAWENAVRGFQADLKTLCDLAADPSTNLLARVPHDPKGPTILHEVLLVADHNAYHLGQLIVLRRGLGAWKE